MDQIHTTEEKSREVSEETNALWKTAWETVQDLHAQVFFQEYTEWVGYGNTLKVVPPNVAPEFSPNDAVALAEMTLPQEDRTALYSFRSLMENWSCAEKKAGVHPKLRYHLPMPADLTVQLSARSLFFALSLFVRAVQQLNIPFAPEGEIFFDENFVKISCRLPLIRRSAAASCLSDEEAADLLGGNRFLFHYLTSVARAGNFQICAGTDGENLCVDFNLPRSDSRSGQFRSGAESLFCLAEDYVEFADLLCRNKKNE